MVRPGTGPRPAPKRRFGQNFLADPRLAAHLVDLFAPRSEDVVVEIGPGLGALTRHLAGHCRRLVALEIDPRMLAGLATVVEGRPGAEVRQADALEVDWGMLARELGGPLRVIGNLPYNVGTAIVRRLIGVDEVLDIQVVLQLEVAGRILAGPGVKAYGPLSIIAALRCRRERLRLLSPGSFRPRPKVTSAALRLTRLDDPPLAARDIPILEKWLFAGFGQRRKTLANNLSAWRPAVGEFLESRGLPLDSRPEAVSPGDWLELARRLGRAPEMPSL